ncbi:MAG: acetate kinase [Clostridiales bacterium]|nr:acetate kinase [Clostridiales bacterium]
MYVLVVNAGSSSLKYQLLDTANESVLAKGNCERIGIDGLLEHKKADGTKIKKEIAMPNHSVATKIVVDMLTDKENGCIGSMSEIEAVGHRIVHGGQYFKGSTLITDDVMAKLELCRDFAPLHIPASIMGIKGCTAVMPNVPQVAVFDTSFHSTMPAKAYTYPIPYQMSDKYGIRKYGFHGMSHKYVSEQMTALLDKPASETKIVTCHIGNGSSISAVMGGKCVDTTMGFTPLDGLEMGTRCGSIDPAVVTFIMMKEGYGPDEMSNFMNKKCGFLGVTGEFCDSRDIEQGVVDGNERCKLAADIQAYQVKKYIGSYAAAMNGLDAVVFTAGLGENCPELRERVCRDMEYLGIEIDYELNAKTWRQPNIVELSTKNSKVKVFVIPTNEELVIARETEEIVNG